MKNMISISKRGITAILTLCILLGIAGTWMNVTAMAEETTVATEETAVATEEITTVVVEESTIFTKDITLVTEESAQELVPVMARRCENDYSNIISGKPYVPYGCTMVRNDVASVKSSYFIDFVIFTFGSFRSNEWKKHMETWEDDDGNSYECHYWQGPNGVTYYYN